MKLTDPRLRAQLRVARGPLGVVLLGSVAGAGLVIAQAFVLTALIVTVVRGQASVGWALAACAVVGTRALVALAVDVAASRAAGAVGMDLRTRALRAALSAPDGGSSGELATLLSRGVTAAEPYVTRYLPAMFLAAILPALTVVAIATQDVVSAAIVVATLPLIPVFAALVGIATRDQARTQWRLMESLSGHFIDVMKGLPTLVAFRRATAQSAVIRAMTERYRIATLRTLRIAFASSAVLELVATLSVALVAVVVGVRLAGGGLGLETALVVLLLAPEAYGPLRKAGAEFHAAAEGSATFERLADFGVDVAPRDAHGDWSGDLTFTDLSVVFPGRTTPALRPVSGVIPPRGITAVVGASGSGKSTLLAALMDLVLATGRVRIGRRASAHGAEWQSQVAWVPQRPTFPGRTIADNLRLAAPSATEEQMWSALREVSLAERVRRMPGRLEAEVGEDADRLSAGERARLALARAVLAARPWVFLDEPTAHLDSATEQIIVDTLVSLARRSSVVVVAHRGRIVQVADRVIRLRPPNPPAGAVDAGKEPVAARALDAPPGAEPLARSVRSRLVAGTLFGSLASASGVALTATAGWLIVKASEQPAVLTLLVAIVGVRAFGLARPVLRYAERLIGHDAALRLLADRRVRVYDAVVPLTPGALGRRRGEALAAIVDDVECVVDRELRVRLPVRSVAGVTLLATVVAAAILPLAGVVVLTVAALAAGWAFVMAGVAGGVAERTTVAARAALVDSIVAARQSASELVMWQAVEPAVAEALDAARRLRRSTTATGWAVGVARAGALGIVGLGVVAMAVLTASAVAGGALSGPMAALLILLVIALADVVTPLADAGTLRSRTAASDRRLKLLEAREPIVDDVPVPEPLPAGREVTLHDVTAGWGGNPALQGLSVSIPAGGRLAVVGPSGSGKSTLAALLLRFLDPTAGDVRLGASSLPRLALDDVRREIGLVDDDPHVFASTVAENVRLARPGASNVDVEVALRAAHLGAWLDGLPDGLQTWLGEGHSQVSGGERARLAVARALLGDQAVLVLDEPTASLDTAAADAIIDEVLDAAADRTVVWISHAPVAPDRMDAVIDLGEPVPVACWSDRS
jgi:ATP-binding cassette subfamily C protein CydCD